MGKRKEKAAKPRIVGIRELAVILNLTPTRIQQLVHEGLPRRRRGKHDQDACSGWYIRYLQALIEKKAIVDPGGEVLANERESRLRLLKADADLREIELARERGQLVTIEEVEKEFADLILISKARIMGIAPRIAPDLVGETSRVMVQARIDKALKEVLLILSNRKTAAQDLPN